MSSGDQVHGRLVMKGQAAITAGKADAAAAAAAAGSAEGPAERQQQGVRLMMSDDISW